MQLLVRKLILGLSLLDNTINFLSASILLGVLFCIHGVTNPFKSKFRNIMEAVILLNLLVIYATAFYNSSQATENVIVINTLLVTVSIYFVISFTHNLTKMECIRKCKMVTVLENVVIWVKQKLLLQKSGSNSSVNNAIILHSVVPDTPCNFKEFQELLLEIND